MNDMKIPKITKDITKDSFLFFLFLQLATLFYIHWKEKITINFVLQNQILGKKENIKFFP